MEGELSAVFESLLGSFQGGSLSGKLFTLVLAGALIELRQRSGEFLQVHTYPTLLYPKKERPWSQRTLTTVIS